MRPRPWQIVVACAVFVLAAWGWTERRGRLAVEARAATVAGEIAGRDVQVRCPGVLRRTLLGFSVTAGHVEFDADGRPSDEAWLEKDPCAALRRLVEGDARSDLACLERRDYCGRRADDLALAVDVLAHEAQHLAGVIAEDVAECRALQSIPRVAEALGASQAAGRAMARIQYETVYPQMPDQYRHGDCAPDRPLDLSPRDGVWP